jgi:hypothetical protein
MPGTAHPGDSEGSWSDGCPPIGGGSEIEEGFTPPADFGQCGTRPVGWPSPRYRSVQLQQVVHRAEQRPLVLHGPLPAPEKLLKLAGVFDLSEDRFHDRLATRVHGASSGIGATRRRSSPSPMCCSSRPTMCWPITRPTGNSVPTTYDRRHTERATRRAIQALERQGYRVTLERVA